MQGGLKPSDRKLLLVAGGLFVLLAAGTSMLTPPAEDSGRSIPSTDSTRAGGARAAYLLLREMGYPVEQWIEPPTSLPRPGQGKLLILAEPVQAPSEGEQQALLEFVQSGGQVLFCGPLIGAFFRGAALSKPIEDSGWKEFQAALPSGLSRGAQSVAFQPDFYWGPLHGPQLRLYGAPDAAVVVTWRKGSGRVIWWASASPLTNGGIRRAGNLRLFLNTLEGSRIYWDEYYHGQRGSLWSYFERTPVPWALVQVAVLAIAMIVTYSRRSGPVIAPARVSRLAPLEFVETLGGLYQRAGAARVAVEVSLRHFRLALRRRLALASSVSDRELAGAAAVRLGWDGSKTEELLASAGAAARVERLAAREALGLVKRLERRTAELRTGKTGEGD